MRCPNCEGRCIGRVGSEQYYCWDCCVEFNLGRGRVAIYHVDADGELVAAATQPAADWTVAQTAAAQQG